MSARATDPVDDFLLGVRQGQRDSAAKAVLQLVAKQDEINELQLKVAGYRRRAAVAGRHAQRRAIAWSLTSSLITAIAVYNVCLHGWFS